MSSSNLLGFCCQKRWDLLSSSVSKRVKYIKKKVVRHITDDLESSPNDFADSDDSDIIRIN